MNRLAPSLDHSYARLLLRTSRIDDNEGQPRSLLARSNGPVRGSSRLDVPLPIGLEHEVVHGVAPDRPARRDERGRVVLLDDQGPGDGTGADGGAWENRGVDE